MKRITAVLILAIGLNSMSPLALATDNKEKKEKGYAVAEMGKAAYLNVVDILPFLTTFGLAIIQQQLKAKDDVANPTLATILPLAPIVIPSFFSLSNLYARVSELRETRSLVSQDSETQNAITSQQNMAIAKYVFWIPLSVFAAFRLASNPDASARILYILSTYILAASSGSESSPIEILRESLATTLDNLRKESGTPSKQET